MDITAFVVQGRDKALLYGDYSTYHHQLANRLLNSRKKLHIATKHRGKFRKAEPLTAEAVAQNHEYVHLLLLTSERAWAQAMSMKAAHSADQKGVKGRSRSHIISRLEKAARTAEELASVLAQSEISGASPTDILEAQAYAALIRGTMQFEKRSWEPCLRSYAVSRIVYSALAKASQADIFKELLSETIDPSIRYAAYQLKTPRTVPIPVIAKNAFPRNNESLVSEINKIDPSILSETETDSGEGGSGSGSAPETLVWRSREVKIEDAQIAAAWSAVNKAKSQLKETIAKLQGKGSHEIALAYDGILMATQDAVDATKEAIDELKGEGVAQSDPRMQSLQITRTAVNYEMISWRVGRNRVLTGPHDGATEEYGSLRRKKKTATADKTRERELPPSKKLAKLKEKSALYDGNLQNLESIRELPGVAADETLATRIDVFENYFKALKFLAIARSHAITNNAANALALINQSYILCREASSKLAESQSDSDELPLNIEVSTEAIKFLGQLLNGELQRHRAIVHVDNIRKESEGRNVPAVKVPLIDRLYDYPAAGVDLDNVVEFPPKPALIPVKPIFLDVAWNYIHYPGRVQEVSGGKEQTGGAAGEEEQAAQPQKRGWFGFGRG